MPQAVIAAVAAVGSFIAGSAVLTFFAYVGGAILLTKLTNKLFGVKAGKSSFAGIQTTSRGSLDYRKIVYGEAMVGGTIFYNNTRGTTNEFLDFQIAYCDHEIDSVISFKLDNVIVPVGNIAWTPPATNGAAGTGTGLVSLPKFVGTNSADGLYITWYPGHTNQPAAPIAANYTELDNINHRARGVFHATITGKYDEDTEKVWEKGPPRSMLARIKGRLIYDPRLDTTNGGTGTHRYDDETTWEWSDNPALCLADYIVNYMGADPAEDIDWPAVIDAADDCDVVVSVPAPVNTQKRFTCNGVVIQDENHENVLDDIKQCMAGRLAWTGGQWVMWAGVYQAPTLSFDESDMKGDIQITGQANEKERYNIVRGFYIDPQRQWRPVEFFPQTNASYVARDAGKEKEFEMDMRMVNSEYQSQRVAIRKLEQFDNQRTFVVPFGANGAKLYPGLEFQFTFGEMGWTNKVFRCIGWVPKADGRFEITAREDYSSRYTDPLVGGYTTRTAAGAIVTPDLGVPAPTGLSTSGLGGIVQLEWTNPPSSLFEWVEIWVSTTDDVGTASKIAEVRGNSYSHVVSDTTTRYYWVRNRAFADDYSTYEPNTTAGVSGTATEAAGAAWQYIKPTNGTAIKNGIGTLTIEARDVTAGVDTLLSSGTIRLYVGSTEVTVANGYAAGSDGFTGVFDSGDISNDVVVELKDGPTGDPIDTITLVDIADGLDGGPGSDAVYGFIEPSNGLAWTRAVNAGAWTPAGTTTDLDCTFVQAGSAVARISRRITLTTSNGNLAASVTAHPSGDLNTGRVTVTVTGSASTAITVQFAYSFGGEDATVAETIKTAQSGDDGADGAAGIPGDDGYNTATLTAFKRSASAPTDDPGTLVYTFATAGWTPGNGWSKTVPAGSNPLYAVSATAFSQSATDTVNAADWSTPVILAEDGADGATGDPGADGADGLNVATAYIYQRSDSLTPPAVPSVTATYTFATGNITGLNNGWTDTVPADDEALPYLYVTIATASNTGTTDSLLTGEWQTPELLSRDGQPSGLILSSRDWDFNTTTFDNMGPWDKYAGLASNMSFNKDVAGPFGEYPMVLRIVGANNNPGWFGGLQCWHNHDINKSYVYYTWIRRYGPVLGGLYMGFWNGASALVDLAGTDAGQTNPYYISNLGSGLDADKWYLAVGVIWAKDSVSGDQGIAGLYDPVTGEQVYNGAEFEWAGDLPPSSFTFVHRIAFYDNAAPAIPPTQGFEYCRPTVWVRDGSEPSIEAVLGAGAITGNYRDIIFRRSASKPATPTGDNPSGWTHEVPAGTDALWQSTGNKTSGGVLIGSWSVPELITGMVYRGSYSGTTAYIIHDVVTYQERTYICVQAGTGNAPTGTNSANAYWDLLAGKGDPGDPASAYTATLAISGGGPVNLRSLADADGYDGIGDATVTYNLNSATVVGTAGGAAGIDTGSWPAAATIDLTLNINTSGIVRGGGGNGGNGGTDGSGGNGGSGGAAINCQEDITINVNTGGAIYGGGGGGGGGGSGLTGGPEPLDTGGGGGGGGFPNGLGGSGGGGLGGAAGSPGTTSGGGAGGGGGQNAGDGGNGGNASIDGVNGQAGNVGGFGSGGADGFAIARNGNTVDGSRAGTVVGEDQ